MARSTALRRVGLAVLGVNVALLVLKALVWSTTGSLAVGSEAVNSLADAAYSLVIVVGLYVSTQPPDFEHPHGHERIEPFVSLLVALGIFAAGALILWRSATTVLSGDVTVARGPAAVGVLALAAVAKFGLYRYCLSVAREHRSPALVATAKDNRNDIFTAIAALLGVAGAMAGFPLLDPIAAGVVAVGILYTGYEVVSDNVDYLVGAAPPEDLRREIISRALEHPDVEGAHDAIAHYVGPEIDVSVHVEVEGDMTLREAHAIESAVVQSIEELPEVDEAFVHVDPKELGEWKPDEDVDRVLGHDVKNAGSTGDDRP